MQCYVFVDDGSPEAADDAANYVPYDARDPQACFAAQLEAIRRLRELRRGKESSGERGVVKTPARSRPAARRLPGFLTSVR